MKFSVLTATALLTVISTPALAAPFVYEPEHCEFKITFPEKPYIDQKCTSGDTKLCTEVVTYTKVLTAESSVDFRITCDAATEKEIESYTSESMEAVVREMAETSKVEVGDIDSATRGGYKTAAVVSVGTRNDREIFYTAQLWVGKSSLFKLEANMLGPQDDKADALFTQILKSMTPKNYVKKELPSSQPPEKAAQE